MIRLSRWFNELKPLDVDIIGDYAGKELFVIHGDSLLVHCVTEAKVDYHGSYSNPPIPDTSGSAADPSCVLQEVSNCCMPYMPWRCS